MFLFRDKTEYLSKLPPTVLRPQTALRINFVFLNLGKDNHNDLVETTQNMLEPRKYYVFVVKFGPGFVGKFSSVKGAFGC